MAVITFLVCLPTLNIYFLTDDFAFVHAFHQLSTTQFLRLLQMDTRVFVSGNPRQEFRPFFSLFYAWGYHFWGLRPWGYHVCEMALHAIVAVLVFLTVNTLALGDLRRPGSPRCCLRFNRQSANDFTGCGIGRRDSTCDFLLGSTSLFYSFSARAGSMVRRNFDLRIYRVPSDKGERSDAAIDAGRR